MTPYVKEIQALLPRHKNLLTPREQTVMTMRLNESTLAEIAETFSITVIRVRSICNKAMNKMRVASQIDQSTYQERKGIEK